MAAFASFAEAEARAAAKVLDGTWVEAFPILKANGAPAVRFMRYMNVAEAPSATFDLMNKAGAWDETTDNATV